jgi:alpha-beta hydrolase superfamily lysophospholipase
MEKKMRLSMDGYEIPIKLTEPDFGPVTRCVLGVHGFCGNKESLILESVAEEMALFGTATVCFDFPCHGENPTTEKDLTLLDCEMTLLNVAHWIQEEYPDTEKCLFATGFGSFITVQCLEGLETVFDRLRLVLQTPDFRMSNSLLAMLKLSEEAFRKQGRVHLGRTGERGIEVPFSFYEQMKMAAVYQDFDVPMLLIHGELDDVVALEDVRHFRRINDHARLVIIPGADHQFRGEGQWDMVVDLTRDWFETEQILLCDWE